MLDAQVHCRRGVDSIIPPPLPYNPALRLVRDNGYYRGVTIPDEQLYLDHPPTPEEREALIRAGRMPMWTMPCTECSRAVPPNACIFCSGTGLARAADTGCIYDPLWKKGDRADPTTDPPDLAT